jgi:hypothetical protein
MPTDTTTIVTDGTREAERIGPSFYTQGDLDAARLAAAALGYGIGLRPGRAEREAEAVAALDLKESA